ncbi:MAG TPA: hypothetical protein VKU83_03000 [Puia sp.]|nr:hypothetical protein [Puia sp.]
MKTSPTQFLWTALVFIFSSCQKDGGSIQHFVVGQIHNPPVQDSIFQPPVVLITDSQQMAPPILPRAPLPQQPAPALSCPALPIYGDSIVYAQPANGGDFIIQPVNNPGPGTYLSWPVGMVIDSATGAIDLTASQSGMKYIVGFVKSGSTDTCLSTLIIGGASYADSVYILNNNRKVAGPYFEGNPANVSLCQTANACTFDVTGSAGAHGVVINPHNGQIDLLKTLKGVANQGGAFGPAPVNGQTITADFYYQINDDPSNNAVQHTSLQFVYYDNEALINAGLLNTIVTRLDNLVSGNLISTTANPKPPLIVIVRHN